MLLLLCIPAMVQGQSWDINMGAGLSYARLIPVNNSTKHSKNIRYGFQGPGIYLVPELCINVSGHSKFSFGMQFSENRTGVKFKAENSSDHEVIYESFDLYNFFVGYYGFMPVAHERATLGWFAKAGLAYGYNTGGGAGSEGSSFMNGTPYPGSVQTHSLTNFDVMPAFWMPTTAVGITVGTNAQNRTIADRLTFQASLTMGWKNIYRDYAKVEYNVITLQSSANGTAQYQGMPVLLQFGASYRLFHFGHCSDY